MTRAANRKDVLALATRMHPMDCGKPFIRIGGNTDGGYLVPDDLGGIEYCFSPGVGSSSSFEAELAQRGIKSFLADGSIDSCPLAGAIWDKKFLGAEDNDRFFTLDSWRQKYLANYNGDLLLQMDIEGFEYEVIRSAPASLLAQFRIIVAEFHFLDRIFDSFVFDMIIKPSLDKLLAQFHVVHIHPNNCLGITKTTGIHVPRVMEVTFYNKQRVQATKARTDFPHPLDRDNVPNRPTLPLPRMWYA